MPLRVEVVPYLAAKAMEGDLVITMGAGDVTASGPQRVDARAAGAAGAADAPGAAGR